MLSFRKLEHGVEVEVVDKVPDALHHVLHRALALSPVAKSLVARRPVGKPVGPALRVDDGEAGGVQIAPTAPHAGVVLRVAHARLEPLRLAVGHALPAAALSLLD